MNHLHRWNMTTEQKEAHDLRVKRVYYINGIAVRDSGYNNEPEMITDMRDEIIRTSVKMDESYDKDCDDNQEVYCPYCKHSQEEWWECLDPRLEDEGQEHECHSCERTFIATPSFGYGWKTVPKPCLNGAHQFEVTRQYQHDGRVWRVAECKNCFEHNTDYSDKKKPAFALLPWNPEYNNPDYFDPKGTLKASGVYGHCSEECGCGYQGKLELRVVDESFEEFEDEPQEHWYACPECSEEVEPCNILELELKTPVLDQVFRDIKNRKRHRE